MTDDSVVTAQKVLDYLKQHAPEVAAVLEKDMTASDVHQPTELKTYGTGKKAKNFAAALAETKNKPKVKPDDSGASVEKEWRLPFDIIKAEPERRQIFGWASISTRDGQIVVDKQNDVILPEDLEKAAYEFVLYSRAHGDMHKTDEGGSPVQTGRIIESMVFTKQKQDILKIDLGLEGWWVGIYVDDDEVWAAHKRGERPEFSIGGKGRRVNV